MLGRLFALLLAAAVAGCVHPHTTPPEPTPHECPPPTTGTVYIDPQSGNDANDCASEQTACKTATKMQALMNSAKPGQQILLKRGTTLTTNGFTFGVHGASGQPIVIGAYGDEAAAKPIVDGTGMSDGVVVFKCNLRNYWTIQDLEIKGNKGAVAWYSCKNHLFQRNITSACEHECIHAWRNDPNSFSSQITIKDNLINAPNRTEGAYVGTDPDSSGGTYDLTQDILIEGNEITNGPSHECIEIKEGATRVTIRNNNIHDNVVTQNGCIYSARVSASSPPGNHTITGNTITRISGEKGFGVRVHNDATITDNAISETSQDGISLEQISGWPVYRRVVTVREAVK
jgi:Right handed beta helix region